MNDFNKAYQLLFIRFVLNQKIEKIIINNARCTYFENWKIKMFQTMSHLGLTQLERISCHGQEKLLIVWLILGGEGALLIDRAIKRETFMRMEIFVE